jgi:IS5 family transposase
MSQLSFADLIVNSSRKVTRSEMKLDTINTLLDWEPLFELVKPCFPKGKLGGRPPKDLGIKTRMLLLQHLYNLSDPELEDQLNDRLSFQRFCGIPLSEPVIDFSTFWRFKERLAEQDIPVQIFEQVNAQLEEKGLFLKRGTIVDASIIASSGRPLSTKKREGLTFPSSQIDTDAQSTKKRGKYYFGYKGHIGVDAGSKLIRKQCFTSAGPHDSTVKEALWSGDERFVSGDSAYSNQQDKQACRKLGIYYGILDKGTRRRKLSNRQKGRNRKKSAVRSAVEHPFAYIKKKLGYVCCRAKNLQRNTLAFTMNCVVYNLMRAGYLLSLK